jgi:hypothetical protein
VYSAIDLRTGEWVAVKQVRIGSKDGEEEEEEGGGGGGDNEEKKDDDAMDGERQETQKDKQRMKKKKKRIDPKVAALQQEISLLEDLDHPNIIK